MEKWVDKIEKNYPLAKFYHGLATGCSGNESHPTQIPNKSFHSIAEAMAGLTNT